MRFHYNTGSQFYRIMETEYGFTPQYRHFVGGNWFNLRIEGSYIECLNTKKMAIQMVKVHICTMYLEQISIGGYR